MALRARIILSSATGSANVAVAEELGVAPATVGKWRRRFVARRLDGLFDEPRPGAPRTVTDDMVEAVIVKTLEAKPSDATHWSTRSMAKAMGMSQTSISLIWRAFGLQPHRTESFKLSTDPLFVEKVRDVVGRELERLPPPWLDVVPAPGPGDRGIADAQVPGQQPRRPVRHPEAFGRRVKGRGDDRRVVDGLVSPCGSS